MKRWRISPLQKRVVLAVWRRECGGWLQHGILVRVMGDIDRSGAIERACLMLWVRGLLHQRKHADGRGGWRRMWKVTELGRLVALGLEAEDTQGAVA